jgi:hypothetical protein
MAVPLLMAVPLEGAVALRRRVENAAGLGLLALLAGVVGRVDPETPGTYPACPFAALTGLACPGCGSLRALHDLVHGSPLAALDHNGLFVVVLVTAVLLSGEPSSARWPAPSTRGSRTPR